MTGWEAGMRKFILIISWCVLAVGYNNQFCFAAAKAKNVEIEAYYQTVFDDSMVNIIIDFDNWEKVELTIRKPAEIETGIENIKKVLTELKSEKDLVVVRVAPGTFRDIAIDFVALLKKCGVGKIIFVEARGKSSGPIMQVIE